MCLGYVFLDGCVVGFLCVVVLVYVFCWLMVWYGCWCEFCCFCLVWFLWLFGVRGRWAVV